MTQSDVLVVGGGPAGSTVANLLARRGVSVHVVEKETFPRFHIGESLLPCDLPIFERLGVVLDRGEYLYKSGAEFVDERTGDHTIFPFAEGLPGTPPHAYQVDRAEFDRLLLDKAISFGAKVSFRERALDVETSDTHVTLRTDAGTHRARFLLDATGQDAFLGRRHRSIEPIRRIGVAARFLHFSGLSDEAWESLAVHGRGNIRVMILDGGWAWLIPLSGRRLSVGTVTKDQGRVDALFEEFLSGSRMLAELTRGASRTEPRSIGNWSYRNTQPSGPRWACVGDASLFLDPVFSSGVSLAMLAGERVADALADALANETEAETDVLAGVRDAMNVAYSAFGALVGSFYNTAIVRNIFFAPSPDPEVRRGLISILAGDVFRSDNAFQEQLIRSNRRRLELEGSDRDADSRA